MKDRLAELKALAPKHNGKESTDGHIEIHNLHHPSVSETDEFLKQEHWDDLDKFLGHVNDIRTKIDQLETYVTHMRHIHKSLLSTLDSEKKDQTRELAGLMDNFTGLSKTTNSLLQKLNHESKKVDSSNDAAMTRIRNDQISNLTRALRNVLTDFNSEQVKYREKCKERMHTYLKIANTEADCQMTDAEIDDAIEKGEFFNTKSVLMGDREKQKLLLQDVQSRHEDIKKLEQSIAELHEMFQDVAMLVESQGEMMNVIERNVENATEYAKKAHTNVTQAREAKHRNMKLKVIACVGCTILIFVILLLGAGAFCFYLPFICR